MGGRRIARLIPHTADAHPSPNLAACMRFPAVRSSYLEWAQEPPAILEALG